MSDLLDQKIKTRVEWAIKEHVFPGAVVGYVTPSSSNVLPFGQFTYDLASQVVNEDTLFDVASITKSIPTNSLILQLIEQGKVGLDDLVITFVPELQNQYREHITVRHLLTYTAVWDLPQGLATYAKYGAEKIKEIIFTAPLQAAPGEKYYYTNPPALLLGMIIEKITGLSLDIVAEQCFFAPLKMHRTTFNPEKFNKNEIVPTEIDWRGEVWAEVHDESAWALRKENRIAGNAGLFSTASDLLIFLQMLLHQGEWNDRRYFQKETITQMYTNQLEYLHQSVGLGWELARPEFMGSVASNYIFGKTGFTGCLVLADPEKGSAMVLLCNRTYPKRPSDREPIHAIRRDVADLIFRES